MMVSLSDHARTKEKEAPSPEEQKKAHLTKVVLQCTVKGTEKLEYKDLISRIMIYDDYPREVSKKTAERRFKTLIELGIMDKDEEGKFFYVNNKPVVRPPEEEKGTGNDEVIPF